MRRSRGGQSEHGAILAFTGIMVMTLVAMAVVGVDLGRLAFTATEVQTVAESAATGYAVAMQRGRPSPAADAYQVVAGNSIDGAAATPTNIASFEVGNYSAATQTFVSGAAPQNAVKATATATVSNFFAAIVGDSQSTVQKAATAAIGCPAHSRMVLPIVVGECEFTAFESSQSCSDLPRLFQQPGDNSCWSTLMPTPGGGATTTKSYLPTTCCDGTECGGGVAAPSVSIGDVVYHTNGQTNSVMHLIEDCVENDGMTDYVVAVVECDANLTDCVGASPVVGFASVRVSNVVDQGGDKSVDLEFFCNDDGTIVGDTGGVAEECFGMGKVAMVQ